MKFFIAFAALIASVSAVPGIVNTGSSAVTRSDDGLGNYAFGYNEDHATGGTFRKEKGSHGVQVGSYGLRDADGRMRTVNYVADAHGFRASVQTNEPGVDPHQAAAATTTNGNAMPVPMVPAVAPVAIAAPMIKSYAAPAYAAPAYAAPAYAAPALAYGHGYAAPSSYSVATQHYGVAAAPVYAKSYAAGPILAAPFAGKGHF